MDFFSNSTNWKHFGGFSPPDFPSADDSLGWWFRILLLTFSGQKQWWNSDAFTTLLSLPMFCSILSNCLEKNNHVSSVSSTWKKKSSPFFRFRRAHPYHTSLQNFQVWWFFLFFRLVEEFQTSKLHCFWLVVQPHRPQKGEVWSICRRVIHGQFPSRKPIFSWLENHQI